MPEETLRAEIGIFKAIDGDNWERPFWTWHQMEFCGSSDGLSYLGFIKWGTTVLGGSNSFQGLYLQNTLGIYFSFLALILN